MEKLEKEPIIVVTTGGIETITEKILWKVNNFNLLAEIQDALEYNCRVWEDNRELASCWKLSIKFEQSDYSKYPHNHPGLTFARNEKQAAFYIHLNELPEKLSQLSASAQVIFNLVNPSGDQPFCTTIEGWYKIERFKKAIFRLRKITLPICSDWIDSSGFVTFQLILTLRWPVPNLTDKKALWSLKSFQTGAKLKATQDLWKYSERVDPCHTIKVVAADGVEFIAPNYVLAARSPVLEAMIRPTMAEGKTGIINLPDIGSSALKILLKFVIKGELLEEWSKKENLVDLTCAAHKYQLHDLIIFLDKNLGKFCEVETAGELIFLARKFSLATAEKDILKFIKENVCNSFEDLEMFMKGLTIECNNGSGDGLVKISK